MYCSNCGVRAAGRFCSNCGSRLDGQEIVLAEIVWQDEVRYDLLLKVPQVRERLAASTSKASKKLSGEEFLELAEKALEPLLGGVPICKVAALVVPLYAKLGVSTSKSRSATLPSPPGEVLVAVLCSLAAAGQTVQRVQQAEDGCLIEAELPSDWRGFAGQLIVSVRREGQGTRVEAVAKVLGQIYDWGRNRQAIDRLLSDLEPRTAAA
jgi:hypothetical protein